MNFIKSRMNRDNFWNLMFWLGMTVGWSITFLLSTQDPMVPFVISWSIILGVPFIVAKGSKVKFNKEEDTFFNSNSESLKDRKPHFIFIVLTIAITILVGAILDANNDIINDLVANILLIGIFFLVPTLYFIYKNCPIAILFNRHAWFSKIPGIQNNTNPVLNHSSFSTQVTSSLSPSSWTTDPGYKHLSSNIHHRR